MLEANLGEVDKEMWERLLKTRTFKKQQWHKQVTEAYDEFLETMQTQINQNEATQDGARRKCWYDIPLNRNFVARLNNSTITDSGKIVFLDNTKKYLNIALDYYKVTIIFGSKSKCHA